MSLTNAVDRKLVIAIDLDGTLVKADPRIGAFQPSEPLPDAVRVCCRLWEVGHTLLLDTVRCDEWHLRAWLDQHFVDKGRIKLPFFRGVNCNPQDVSRTGIVAGHVYADVYINDKNWQAGKPHAQEVNWLEVERDFEARNWLPRSVE